MNTEIRIDLICLCNSHIHSFRVTRTVVNVLIICMSGIMTFICISLEDKILSESIHIIAEPLHIVRNFQERLLHAACKVVTDMEESARRIIAARDHAVCQFFQCICTVLPVHLPIVIRIFSNHDTAIQILFIRL